MTEKKKSTSEKKAKILLILSSFIVLLAVLGSLIWWVSAKKQTAKESLPSYDLFEVVESEPLMFKGTVEPSSLEEIYYDVTLGKITNIAITNEQKVKKGEVLLTYENEEVKNEVSQQQQSLSRANLGVKNAQENLAQAKNNLEKSKTALQNKKNELTKVDLSKPEGTAQQTEIHGEIVQLEAEVAQGKEVLQQMNQALEGAQLDLNEANKNVAATKEKITTTVTSPMEGIVYVDEKGKNNPQIPVLKIISPSVLVSASVSEYDFKKLAKDQAVEVIPVVDTEKIAGKIMSISPLPSGASSTTADNPNSQGSTTAYYPFKVSLDKPLQYGFNVQIKLALKEIKIPKSAVVKEGENYFVFLVTDKKAKKTSVKVLEEEDLYLVQEGLKVKDKIILTPDAALKDGQTVVE